MFIVGDYVVYKNKIAVVTYAHSDNTTNIKYEISEYQDCVDNKLLRHAKFSDWLRNINTTKNVMTLLLVNMGKNYIQLKLYKGLDKMGMHCCEYINEYSSFEAKAISMYYKIPIMPISIYKEYMNEVNHN